MENNKTDGEIFAPGYYESFTCIAERCRHSCCIDWEICIDEHTYKKYTQHPDLLRTVRNSEDGPCFALKKDGRCPHLNKDGLCNIIIKYGKELLSEICDRHPRFFNGISTERTEAGLGIVCEEACRLILENEEPFSLKRISAPFDKAEARDETYIPQSESPSTLAADNTVPTLSASAEPASAHPETDFNPLLYRDRIISVTEAPCVSFEEKICALKSEFKLPTPYTEDEWLKRFLRLEILDKRWKRDLKAMRGSFLRYKDGQSELYGKYYGRLLTYFVYRHVSTAESALNLRARLAFCILSVEVIRSLFEQSPAPLSAPPAFGAPEELIDFARRYSAEIEYSEGNTEELIFEFESELSINTANT